MKQGTQVHKSPKIHNRPKIHKLYNLYISAIGAVHAIDALPFNAGAV